MLATCGGGIMKSYFYAILIAIIMAFVFGSGWYTFFGYDPYASMLDNLISVYTDLSFWRGLLIWSFLYSILLTIPITFLKNKATNR